MVEHTGEPGGHDAATQREVELLRSYMSTEG